MAGSISELADQDAYRFMLRADSHMRFEVVAAGDNPISDPELTIATKHGQFVAYNDDSNGLYPVITATLPAAEYSVIVSGVGSTGTYELRSTAVAAVAPRVPLNTTIQGSFVADQQRGYWFTLDDDARVDITFNGNAIDGFLELRQYAGGLIEFVDDASSLDPRLRSHLPAGTYFLALGELLGASGAFRFQIGSTSAPIPDLLGAASIELTLRGGDDRPVLRVDVDRPSVVTIATRPGVGIDDPVMTFSDDRLTDAFFRDDDANSLFPTMSLPVPAGRYLIRVHDLFRGSGTVTVAATRSNVAPPAFGGYRTTLGQLPPGNGTAAFRLRVGTPAPLELRARNADNDFDPVVAVLDGAGRVIAANDDSGGTLNSAAGMVVPPGEYWLLVREFGNSGGAFVVEPRSRLWVDGNRRIQLQDKAGQFVPYLAAVHRLPGPISAVPFEGFQLVDLIGSAVLATPTLPSSGQRSGMMIPTGIRVYLQGASLDRATGRGAMTNMVELR